MHRTKGTGIQEGKESRMNPPGVSFYNVKLKKAHKASGNKEEKTMLVPSIFGEDLFDDFMRFPTIKDFGRCSFQDWSKALMKTDIKESENGYELAVDLPGFDKEEMKLHLKDGYLTIEAARTDNKEEKDENGKYLRRERYSGSCSRTFFGACI